MGGPFPEASTPLEHNRFDKEYKQMVDLDVEAIKILCREESSPMDRGSLSTEANEQQQSPGHNGPYKRASQACRY